MCLELFAGSANLVMTHRDRAKYSSKHLLQQTEQVNTVMRPFVTTGCAASDGCNDVAEAPHLRNPHATLCSGKKCIAVVIHAFGSGGRRR